MSTKLKNNFLLLLTAFIWGSSFVAQSAGMEYVGPLTFNGVRCLLGAVLLGVVWMMIDRFHILEDDTDKREIKLKEAAAKENDPEAVQALKREQRKNRKALLTGGVLCGIVLLFASTLQQVGMVYTTAGKAGFLTALYMILVPFWGMFFGKKVGGRVWIAVLLSLAGMYLLCIKTGFVLGLGDSLVLLCSLFYTAHILVIDRFSPLTNGIKLSCIQFFVTGTICTLAAVMLEHPSVSVLLSVWFPIFYAGGLSCAVAYTLQIIAQKKTDPTIASLLFSLESVFAMLMGWLILGDALSFRETVGCVLMFSATILAQVPVRLNKKKQKG